MLEHHRYIGGPTGGIDANLFTPKNSVEKGKTLGQSGALFTYEVSPTKIFIAAEEREHIGFFHAHVVDGEMRTRIQTKDKNHTRHPDLYGKKLFKESFAYFQKNTIDIHTILATWVAPDAVYQSDNFVQYRRYLLTKATITDEDRRAAALSTWTGTVASELGFSKVASVEMYNKTNQVDTNNPKFIFATFIRP